MRMPMTWRRVQTLNAPGGRPVLVIAPELLEWYVQRFGAAHVSITDEMCIRDRASTPPEAWRGRLGSV